MIDLLDYVPIAAAGFAVPQFLPQIRKLRASGLHAADPRLITLGASGIIASALMLAGSTGPPDVSQRPCPRTGDPGVAAP